LLIGAVGTFGTCPPASDESNKPSIIKAVNFLINFAASV